MLYIFFLLVTGLSFSQIMSFSIYNSGHHTHASCHLLEGGESTEGHYMMRFHQVYSHRGSLKIYTVNLSGEPWETPQDSTCLRKSRWCLAISLRFSSCDCSHISFNLAMEFIMSVTVIVILLVTEIALKKCGF